MIQETNIDSILSVTTEYYSRVQEQLEKTIHDGFSKDVYGINDPSLYKKALAIHHIGFVVFLAIFTIEQEEDVTRENDYYKEYFQLDMLNRYLSCNGIRDDVLTDLITEVYSGIGFMTIEGENNPFKIT